MDARRRIGGAALLGAVGALTIPRLLINYGLDGDAARGARAAQELAQTGIYHPSRLPGNPLFEYLLALIVPWGGHSAANGCVLLFYALSVAAFWWLTPQSPRRPWLIGLFALTPILLVNAATALDYIPGLALLLLAYGCAARDRPGWSGLFLALATGMRLSNVLFLGPLLLFLLLRRRPLGSLLRTAGISLVLGLAFYLPIFAESGFAMFAIPPSLYSTRTYLLSLGYNALLLFGPLASAVLLVLVIAQGKTILAALRQRPVDVTLVLEISTVLAFGALFLLHADEAAYLIPIIPFVYLLLARWLPGRALALAGLLVIASGLGTVELKGGASGRRVVQAQPAWGPVVADYLGRQDLERLRGSLDQLGGPRPTVVLTGLGPVLTYENPLLVPADYQALGPSLAPAGILEPANIYKLIRSPVYFVYGLSRENVARLQSTGYTVAAFSEFAPTIAINKFGYDPAALGLRRLDIMDATAFYQGKE